MPRIKAHVSKAAQNLLNGAVERNPNPSTRPYRQVYQGDARDLSTLIDPLRPQKAIQLESQSVDLIVTSPPYWRKRDYRLNGQIGQEANAEGYVNEVIKAILEWRRVLRPTGSIFLNIGDTYWRKSLQGIPSLVESKAREKGLIVRNRIVWIKRGGNPDPVRDRLASRHEYILHIALNGYYYDLFGYAEQYSVDRRGA